MEKKIQVVKKLSDVTIQKNIKENTSQFKRKKFNVKNTKSIDFSLM